MRRRLALRLGLGALLAGGTGYGLHALELVRDPCKPCIVTGGGILRCPDDRHRTTVVWSAGKQRVHLECACQMK